MPNADNHVFELVQNGPDTIVSQTALTPVFGGALISLQGTTSMYPQLAFIFDQYRIDCAEFTFRPMFLGTTIASSATAIVPQLLTVVDYDDANALTNVAAIQQYANLQVSTVETQVRRFVPHCAVGAYSGTFVGFANREAQWLDSASVAVQHYGVKWAIEAGLVGQTALQSFTISSRVHFSFRNVT
jgi:hypothetical protein